ncbi:dispanin subfamily A member 2b-like [Rhinophrynus dorsalis]
MEYPNQPVQSTVVPIVSHEPPLRDYLPWSIFNTMYMNFCCLGFIALVFSVKARDRNLVGDKLGARNYGGTARNLNISATVLTIIFSIIIIIICVSGAITLYSTVSSSYNQNSQGYYGK